MTEMKNNIRQRPNGTWEGRYYDVDGKQHSLYGRTKAIVKDKLASKRAEIVSGNSITETDLTVEQWGWEWMQTFKAGKIKHSTMDNYESDFRLHVIPYIGHVKLKDVTSLMIQRVYILLEEKGLSPKSIRNVHGMLHGMLDKAMKMDLIRKNVSNNCELPPIRKTEMHPLTKEEMGTFMTLAKDDEYYLMMRFDFFTGLRESELIGLTWDCVDFEKHTLRIYRQFVRIASGPRQGQDDVHAAKERQRAHHHPDCNRPECSSRSQAQAERDASARRKQLAQRVQYDFHPLERYVCPLQEAVRPFQGDCETDGTPRSPLP